MKRRIIVFVFFVFLLVSVDAQKIVKPVIHSKSHPSMLLDSISLTPEHSTFYLTIINENTEGNAWFCADNNISILEYSSGTKHTLNGSYGIPSCPDAHQFSTFGEKLHFQLQFPPLEDSLSEIDLIENCSDNCFSLKGIILNPVLNQEIRLFEQAVQAFNEDKLKLARDDFSYLTKSQFKQENHYAYSLYILPVIYARLEDSDNAIKAYNNLLSSSVIEKNYFLEKLQMIDFFREMNRE